MSFHLLASSPTTLLLSDNPVIPRDSRRVVEDACAILALAEARLAEVENHRAAEIEAARAEGLAAGHADGLALAQTETAEIILGLQQELEAERARLRASVGGLALDVVRRIAADLGPEATLSALAERAVRDLTPDGPVVVHVSPAVAGAVGARLWPIGGATEVRADPGLADGDCILETALGRNHAGLEVQLAALERAFGHAETQGDPS